MVCTACHAARRRVLREAAQREEMAGWRRGARILGVQLRVASSTHNYGYCISHGGLSM